MQIAMIGLGRMGANMCRRLLAGGHTVVGYDRDTAACDALAAEGAIAARSLDELVAALTPPRAVWVMLPAGAPTETTIATLGAKLAPGDVIIDGGNTYFKDDIRRAGMLSDKKIALVDAGTSGGVWGRERGYCLMVGGTPEAIAHVAPALATLAPGESGVAPTPGLKPSTATQGWLHCGPVGAGHFVKMVHNGIEYGLMQAYAEGFDLLRSVGDADIPAAERYRLDIGAIAELWRRGSVVGSWLLDLSARALAADPALEGFTGHVADSGEGRWTVQAAVDAAVPLPTLTEALFARFRSRRAASFADKLLSAMRFQFGGHREAR